MTKQMIAFDLDGTLAESKQPIQPAMAALLAGLTKVASIAVISGGDWPQFETQVVAQLPADTDWDKVFIMPTTGTKLYRHRDGEWRQVYADLFSADEKAKIVAAVHDAYAESGYHDDQVWGDQIEDRGSQITFSGLGQEAPLDAKKAWDPDNVKRRKMQELASKQLPDLDVKVGGSTSIDITRKGVDKAAAMRKLEEHSGVAKAAMLFMGDAIYPGGNDDPVRGAGYDVIKVRDVVETETAVQTVIYCLG